MRHSGEMSQWHSVSQTFLFGLIEPSMLCEKNVYITLLNTPGSVQNGWQFADDILKCIFMWENICITILDEISLKFIETSPIDNKAELVQLQWSFCICAHSQWETTLQCNIISHWQSTFTKWSLQLLAWCQTGNSPIPGRAHSQNDPCSYWPGAKQATVQYLNQWLPIPLMWLCIVLSRLSCCVWQNWVLNSTRAPSQYKDRLIYVWRFPC